MTYPIIKLSDGLIAVVKGEVKEGETFYDGHYEVLQKANHTFFPHHPAAFKIIAASPSLNLPVVELAESVCVYCNGDGFTAEHDPTDPHEGGVCVQCPIQVQCEHCLATGKSVPLSCEIQYGKFVKYNH